VAASKRGGKARAAASAARPAAASAAASAASRDICMNLHFIIIKPMRPRRQKSLNNNNKI
jgi:hypothetical protein